MTGPRPFKIQIFVADGRPDGLRLVEKSNWIGQAIVCPRGAYPSVKKRDEFSRSGVYILIGPGDDDRPSIYVGEAETVRARLDQHYSTRDFWQQVIVFTTTGTPKNKAEVKYLEARLLELARLYKRCRLENSVDQQRPGLSEADQAEMEGYLDEVLSLLPVLGVDAFLPLESSTNRNLYYLKVKQCDASGFETSTGFMVRKGSRARKTSTPSLKKHFPNSYAMRQRLIDSGILVADEKGLRFAEDHLFNSPSLASSVCAGRSSNGLDEWKDKRGRSLKANREGATAD